MVWFYPWQLAVIFTIEMKSEHDIMEAWYTKSNRFKGTEYTFSGLLRHLVFNSAVVQVGLWTLLSRVWRLLNFQIYLWSKTGKNTLIHAELKTRWRSNPEKVYSIKYLQHLWEGESYRGLVSSYSTCGYQEWKPNALAQKRDTKSNRFEMDTIR